MTRNNKIIINAIYRVLNVSSFNWICFSLSRISVIYFVIHFTVDYYCYGITFMNAYCAIMQFRIHWNEKWIDDATVAKQHRYSVCCNVVCCRMLFESIVDIVIVNENKCERKIIISKSMHLLSPPLFVHRTHLVIVWEEFLFFPSLES